MTHHRHGPDRVGPHPPSAASLSLLRMAAGARLAAALAIAAIVWIAVWWAMS
jgi:hypothetical protein